MKQLISLLLLACAIAAPVQARETRYISDNLFTYMHSGPGTNFRIIGSVNAGTKVTQHESSAGYVKITDSRGREGWVKDDFISRVPGLKERLPALEKELAETKSKLSTAQGDADTRHASLVNAVEDRDSQISELQTRNRSLSEQLSSAETEMRAMRAKLDTQQNDLLMKWFIRGGMVAGAGLLLGLLLPHMIPRRKKKPNGWA